MISLLITLLILALILGLIWWVITLIPFPPGFPIWVIQVVFALIVVLVLIHLLLPWAGQPLLR